MKVCVSCGEEKSDDQFGKNGKQPRNQCKSCKAAYKRQWLKDNPQAQKVYERTRRQKVREYIHTIKERPCVDCGQSYPYWVMDFDHVRGEKKFNISPAKGGRRMGSFKALEEEIAKCEVVCANCHRLRHPPKRS